MTPSVEPVDPAVDSPASAATLAEQLSALAAHRDRLASEVSERTRELEATVEELRRASDAKSEFLANVSHELRTPLTSILGFADLLVAGTDGSLNDAQHQDALAILTNGRHLLELIDDLIDVASIEAGTMRLDRRPVAVGPILEAAVETLRPLAAGKGIWLEVSPVDPDLRALADADRLREIVLNLLSNAIKFTPSRGMVRVTSCADQAADGATRVRIDVTDSGIGIDVADQERIFERFVRTDVPAYPGTGLGLSIAQSLARLHGGDLTVDSTVGLGSTFSVLIPAVGEPA